MLTALRVCAWQSMSLSVIMTDYFCLVSFLETHWLLISAYLSPNDGPDAILWKQRVVSIVGLGQSMTLYAAVRSLRFNGGLDVELLWQSESEFTKYS